MIGQPFSVTESLPGNYWAGAAAALLVVRRRLGAERYTGLRFDDRLIDGGGSGYVAVEGCASGYQVVLHFVDALGSGADADAGSINALLGDQIRLGVDGALRGQVLLNLRRMSALLRRRWRSSFTDHGDRGIRSLLCAQSNLIEASLGFVVDTSRALGVTTEGDRAQRLGLGDWRRRRFNRYRRGARSRLTLIIGDVSGDRDRSSRCAGGGQGGRVAGAADLTSRGSEAIGEWPVLRADAGCRDRGAVARLQRGRD